MANEALTPLVAHQPRGGPLTGAVKHTSLVASTALVSQSQAEMRPHDSRRLDLVLDSCEIMRIITRWRMKTGACVHAWFQYEYRWDYTLTF
ncbi:MAG: hypothetical protein A2W31_08655 [Planctomycetes bacterium RBG_16_64_10]|nr:MAG: hypothetical protein A2W31_08655 [Planctomycetes bacterium RBG_16_64_10]